MGTLGKRPEVTDLVFGRSKRSRDYRNVFWIRESYTILQPRNLRLTHPNEFAELTSCQLFRSSHPRKDCAKLLL
jgi:hypothetical protein